MNKTLPLFISILLFSVFTAGTASAQASVTSTNGYTVSIVIIPRAIVPASNSCQYGYIYNVRIDYSVVFSGPNQPSSLYTLQGTFGCGSASHFYNIPNTQGAGTVTSQSNVWRNHNDCATATVSSLSCNQTTIEIAGPGISHRFITFSTSSVLPVKLTGFTALATDGKVKLNWTTATEINSDYFVVEKSGNGDTWTAVKTVAAAGNSSDLLNYEAYDENPSFGATQYRLKQVDKGGQTEYSMIRTVKFTPGGASVAVFPVPNSGNKINFSGLAEPSNTMMTVQNMSGVTVYTTTLSGPSAELPHLNAGLYIIRLINKVTGQTTNLRYQQL